MHIVAFQFRFKLSLNAADVLPAKSLELSQPKPNTPAGLPAPLLISNRPFSVWMIDFITDLPSVLHDGLAYNGVLTMVDKYSKYCKLIPVIFGADQLTTPVVARHLFDHVIRPFGVPDTVLSDRDPRFTSAFWSVLWRILGTKVILSSAYHP